MAESNNNDKLALMLLGPVAQAAGSTLQDVWDLVFGQFGNYVEKKREIRRLALESFKADLAAKVNKIPVDRICEPPLSIIGPAMEASKYHFEESEIREMFASLISASMDSGTASRIHPAFPTIIQQMSAYDAKNLEYIYSCDNVLPICEYQVRITDNDEDDFLLIKPCHVIYTNVFLSNSPTHNFQQGAVSLSSLSWLGLVQLDYDRSIHDGDYSAFEKTPEYLAILEKYKDDATMIPYIQQGIAVLTPLGGRSVRYLLF